MAVVIKTLVEDRLKGLTGGLGTDGQKTDDKADAAADKMSREDFEEYQQQLMEEKMERDAAFAKRKAERATMRTIFREKYKLPKCPWCAVSMLCSVHVVQCPCYVMSMLCHACCVVSVLSSVRAV
uniref:complexin-3-like n=1 Tax=Myxine glutinosa TaxID=7769 RepID=UPI00358FEEC2